MNGKKAKKIRRECSKAGVGTAGYRRTKKAYKDGTLERFAKELKAQGLS